MTQGISLHTKNANTFQYVNGNSSAQQGAQAPQGSGDLFAQFSMILDKIALHLSHNEELFNVSSELRPAVLAPREEQPVEVEEPETQTEQVLVGQVEQDEVEEEEVAEEVEENSDQNDEPCEKSEQTLGLQGEKPEQTSDELEIAQVPQEAQAIGKAISAQVKEVTETLETVEVSQAQVGEQAATGQEGNDVIARLLREQVARQRESAPVEEQPLQQEQQQVTQQQVGEDLALKDFLAKNGVTPKVSDNEEVKAIETALRALFEQSENVATNVSQESVQQPIVVSPLLLQRALEMSALGKGSEVGTQAIQGITPKASSENGSGHHLGLEQSNRRGDQAEKSETPLSQRATLRTLEKVEQALKEISKSKDGKTISMRLDPPELGNLKIDVTMRDGLLHARIAADNTQVSQMLREKAHDIQRNLRELGLNVDQVSVSVRDEGGQFSQFFSQTGNGTGSENRGQETGQQGPHSQANAGGTTTSNTVVEDHWVA
ncbi:MAG: flagellar hook-length control protein FliK [Bdellovibrionales bacterium]|nr:flagellar hook-length control protein FliK [Bdellovibrionales bacterium]